MKNLVILLSFLFLGHLVSAQNNVIDHYFETEQEDPQFFKLKVNSKAFDFVQEIKSTDTREQNLIASIQKLEGIKGLFLENSAAAKSTYVDAFAKIAGNEAYEELMSLQHEDHKAIFMIRETDDKIEEMMAMFTSDNEFGVVTIFGDIELHSISDLAAVMEKNGKAWFEHFENMSEEAIVFDPAAKPGDTPKPTNSLDGKGWNISVYPNPAIDHVILEALDKKDAQYEIAFYSLLGEQLKDLGSLNLPYRLELKDFPQGTYFVRVTDSTGVFKNYKVIKP